MEKKLSELLEEMTDIIIIGVNSAGKMDVLDPVAGLVTQIKQLEEEAEYWRKLKALPSNLYFTQDSYLGEWMWTIEDEERLTLAFGDTPEEALDAYYKQKQSDG